MPPPDIEIHEIHKMDLKGAVILDGFPSVGLVSTIVTNYIVDTLKLRQIGVVDSMYFPTVSLIRGAEPHNPVRIYGGEVNGRKIGVFISEFSPPGVMIKAVASSILQWAIDQRADMIITPEGLIVDSMPEKPAVYGIGSTKRAMSLLPESIQVFEEGVISGVTGVLLNEGKKRDFDVLALLSEAHTDYPDARAAARIIEAMNAIIPEMNIDPEPLYEEAEKIEKHLEEIRAQAAKMKHSRPGTTMYG